ncbi:MAG: iron ABC transporter permease [Lachnospiraceae bacterium]|nr:iron ABC transporter permease [Lachnospiraceae bacterium]MBR1651057.1 iron ABC transporter permease [Lachnospiraceae bacterium]
MTLVNTEQKIKRIYALEKRRTFICVGLFVVIALALGVVLMCLGNTNYTPAQVLDILIHGGSKAAVYAVRTIRLPKLLIGAISGFSFGVSGYTFQSLLKNPLASPDIIGVTAGSSAAAVFCILILGISGPVSSVFAVAAGLLVTGLILLISGRGKAFGGRMILIGIGFQALLNALISWMLLVGSEYDVGTALRWLRGSLNMVRMSDVPVTFAVSVIACTLLFICNKNLRIMQLGDEYATALGVPIGLTRVCCLVCGLILSATSTAVTGPIASVAFLSGPIAGRLLKGGKGTMALSGLVGVILVYGAEIVSKNLFTTNYPVGVVTGLLGAPYLLFLLFNINKKGDKI